MSTAGRVWIAVASSAALLTLAAATSPLALRRMDSFRIARVQLEGARHLTAEQVLSATGITDSSSLFDDFEPWHRALENHPLVLRARLARRLPDALVVHVVETEAVALLGAPELRPIDARGRVLPIEPAGATLDLPLIVARPRVDSTGAVTDVESRLALDALERVARAQPWLVGWISELEPVRDGVRLRLRWPAGAEILLPPEPDADRLHELRLVLGDLAARGGGAEPDGGELQQLVRIDARYREQLVVKLAPPADPNRPRGAS